MSAYKKKKCEICGVKTCRMDGQKRIFMARFPLDEDRCKQWVAATGNENLIHVPIEKLNQSKYICGKHFDTKYFNEKKTQLKKNAVPHIDIAKNPLIDVMFHSFPLHIQYVAESDTRKDVLNYHNYCSRTDRGETDPLDEYRIRRSKAETTIEEEYLEDDFLYDQDVQEVVSDWDESDDFQKSETVVQEPNNQVHEGFQCNVCQKDIIGFRYACVQCSDWDMCGGCEARGEHARHYVLRVPGPRPYSEIQTILQCIRNELFPELGHVKPIIDCEVKSENESDSDTDISEPQATEKIKTTEKPTIAKVPICSKTNNNISPPKNRSPNFRVFSSINHVFSAPEHPPKTDINARSRIQMRPPETIKMRPPETIKMRPPETKKKITHLKLRVPPEIKLDTLQKSLRRDVVVKVKRLEQRVDYEELIKKRKLPNYSNFKTNFDKHKHTSIINPTLLEP